MGGYTVQLPAFHGPLDLLLHLVRREEVDIRTLPLGRLATQFLDFLAAAALLDVDLAGEFVVIAATLLEIKARSLLPAPPKAEAAPGEAPPDPRRDLVRQLLEYRQFKEAAQALEERAERHATQFARLAPPPDPTLPADRSPPVRSVEVWDLVSAFARLLRETEAASSETVVADDTPQHAYESRVVAEVRRLGRVSLRELFTPPRTRARLIGLFLAVLELVKRRAVVAELDSPFGELWLTAGDGLEPGAAELNPSSAS